VNAPLASGVTVSPAVLLAAEVTLTALSTSTPDDLSAEVAAAVAAEVAEEAAPEAFDTPSFNTWEGYTATRKQRRRRQVARRGEDETRQTSDKTRLGGAVSYLPGWPPQAPYQ